jgi:HK97 family phage major capsid protein
MHSKIRELRAERAKFVTEVRAILDADEVTADDEVRADKVMADADALKVQIDREERVLASEAELKSTVGEPVVKPGEPASVEDRKIKRAEEHRVAFANYIKYGLNRMKPDQRALVEAGYVDNSDGAEQRDLAVGAGATGGYTIPQGFYDKLTEAQKWYGGMRSSRATVITSESGQDLPIPIANDTTNTGALLAEAALVTTLDPTFSQKVLHAYTYTSLMVKASFQMLQDGAFDTEGFLSRNLGIRLARIVNTHLTVGTGANQPRGIVIDAVSGKVGAAGQVTSIIFDDLVDLEHSIDKAYRQGAQWMMNDQLLKPLKKLRDSQLRPLWLPGIAVNAPDTILGYPYVINNDIAVPAANAKSLLFGDLSTYLIRDVLGTQILRLEERYAEFGQVAFLAFERHDGLLLDAGSNPVKYYAHPAA